MKKPSDNWFPRESVIDKIVDLLTLQAPLHKFQVWLDHRFKNGVYELRRDEIVSGHGRRPEDRIKFQQVKAWQVVMEMGFDIIVIELNDGRVLNWVDKYNDLIGILQTVAADREQPWRFR